MKRSYIKRSDKPMKKSTMKVGRGFTGRNKPMKPISDKRHQQMSDSSGDLALLINLFEHKGIGHHCEVRLDGICDDLRGSAALTPAHRHDRLEYYRNAGLLWSYNQVICACTACHLKVDTNMELKKEIFNKLRGEDQLKEAT